MDDKVFENLYQVVRINTITAKPLKRPKDQKLRQTKINTIKIKVKIIFVLASNL